MTGVVVLAIVAALGVVGVFASLRSTAPPLEAVLSSWERPVDPRDAVAVAPTGRRRLGEPVIRVAATRWGAHPRMHSVLSALAITGGDPTLFAARLVVIAAACALAPGVLWLMAQAAGLEADLGLTVIVTLIAVPLGVGLTVLSLLRAASERRRQFRVVISSFVDLVVLSLAGGVGVDGALHAAAQVSENWAAQRLSRALEGARNQGHTPWSALAGLGDEIAVPELVELAATVQLAGTEGARIRDSLAARGEALRRHEQADAESAANAMTERLFLPGALLLLGFLLFIGFPAVHRILGGF